MPFADAFFRDIDRRWRFGSGARLRLGVIGCAALSMQVDYDRGTKDSDVLETRAVDALAKERLLALAGERTDLATRHGLFIQFVPSGLPFLRQRPVWHAQAELNASLKHFEVEVLDVLDVVVSKLKRLHRDDATDIEAMAGRGLVDHRALVECFREALDFHGLGAGADDLERCVENLHWVERDVLGVAETEIELPDWA